MKIGVVGGSLGGLTAALARRPAGKVPLVVFESTLAPSSMLTVVRDYFGVEPSIQVTSTNAYLCLPEYRTCSNGMTLLQVKNYWYDPETTNGGEGLTFTINSGLFSNKTIEALGAGQVIGVIGIAPGPVGTPGSPAPRPRAARLQSRRPCVVAARRSCG